MAINKTFDDAREALAKVSAAVLTYDTLVPASPTPRQAIFMPGVVAPVNSPDRPSREVVMRWIDDVYERLDDLAEFVSSQEAEIQEMEAVADNAS